MKRVWKLLLASALVCTAIYVGANVRNANTPNTYAAQNDIEIIDFVLDYSGSMTNVHTSLKATATQLFSSFTSGTKVGIRLVGVSRGFFKTNCSNATEQGLPIGIHSSSTFTSALSKYTAGGTTPLVKGLDEAIQIDFASFPASAKKKIIVLTDGAETCNGDPCAFAKTLARTHPNIVIDVIMFDSYASGKFECLASYTNGNYYNLTNEDLYNGEFTNVITHSIKNLPYTPQSQSQSSYQTPPHPQPSYQTTVSTSTTPTYFNHLLF